MMNKEQIEVRHKGKVVNIINRVLEHQGQYVGPFFCRFGNKKVEVQYDNVKDAFYIEE